MNKSQYIAIGAGLGLCFGVAFGAAIHNVGLGIALGLPFGAALDVVLGRKKTID
jgi:hypothetical protein